MTRTVVITGVCGFIGSQLAARLVSEGVRVIGVDSSSPTRELAGVQMHRSDLADPAQLLPPDQPVGAPFALVHLAWDTARSPLYRIHAGCVAQLAGLLDYWHSRGLSQFIGAGSAEEYGQGAGVLSESASPAGGLTPYGWGKRAACMMAEAWCRRVGVAALWVRPFIVYGPGQRGDMVIPYAVRQALAGEQARFSRGLQQRDFVFVDDIIDALTLALTRVPPMWHVLNLGTGKGVPVQAVLQRLADLLGASDRFEFGAIPARANEPDLQVADASAAEKVLGWRARVDWQEGVHRLVSSLRAQQ